MTSAQKADADTKYHAVVAMCFDDFAIVIDHALHPTAFKVPLGEYFNMAPYIPLFGSEGQERFKYFLADGEHKLTMDNKETTYGPLYFSEMDIDKATDQIAVPAALEKQPVKDQEHILMPPRKYVSVRSLLDQQPDLITAAPVHDKWLATTVRIQVDFANPMITMQIPMKDWLLTPQKEGWREQICCNAPEGLQIVANDATVRLELKLNATKREVPHHELSGFILMQAIGEQFGLDSEVLKNMMWSVYRVWAPYRPQRTDCALGA
ncbi:hypothetical protein C7974DRAFT_387346 [Boeremia exigua]|uniref:uncharacterized protein n=1 Tax=Boeremia exigua TaxID=749465 RepID=UPI001E8CED0F|nr:uncharacterized protein C7974DRAFT_387346 [Boeremia exigua]KAH6638808.1 hypothetical protein C7974DRAFT_387346 [Boeremia exigua]